MKKSLAVPSSARAERRPKGEGSVFQRKDTGKWYYKIKFKVDGEEREIRQPIPGDHADEDAAWKAAKAIRHECLAKISRHEVQQSRVEDVTCGELLDDYIKFLEANRPRSAYDMKLSINANLRPFFGDLKAAQLETGHFRRFRELRKTRDGVSGTTVNRDLAALRAALKLEAKNTPSRVKFVPYFPMDDESHNVRTGFLDVSGYRKILEHLPESLKCLFVLAYHVGNRRGNLLSLKWSQVDFEIGIIRLAETQDGKHVGTAPIYGEMRSWLARQKGYRDDHYPSCEHVCFWYACDCEIDPDFKAGHGGYRTAPGSPIKDFRRAWSNAIIDAGFPNLLFHDLRRSAVRNMIQKAGISEKAAMEISGHLTHEMIRRYNITSLDTVLESGRRADEWMRSQNAGDQSVKKRAAKRKHG